MQYRYNIDISIITCVAVLYIVVSLSIEVDMRNARSIVGVLVTTAPSLAQ